MYLKVSSHVYICLRVSLSPIYAVIAADSFKAGWIIDCCGCTVCFKCLFAIHSVYSRSVILLLFIVSSTARVPQKSSASVKRSGVDSLKPDIVELYAKKSVWDETLFHTVVSCLVHFFFFHSLDLLGILNHLCKNAAG